MVISMPPANQQASRAGNITQSCPLSRSNITRYCPVPYSVLPHAPHVPRIPYSMQQRVPHCIHTHAQFPIKQATSKGQTLYLHSLSLVAPQQRWRENTKGLECDDVSRALDVHPNVLSEMLEDLQGEPIAIVEATHAVTVSSSTDSGVRQRTLNSRFLG